MRVFRNLTFKLASGPERTEAIRLRKELYQEELGYHGSDEFDDDAHQLIAVDEDGQIVGAIRILDPLQRPFEIERFVNIESILGDNRTPGQIGGFWIRTADRRVQGGAFLPLGMLKVAFMFARKRGITDFVMRTHVGALQRFYERGLFRLV